jgi:hypothetical protein
MTDITGKRLKDCDIIDIHQTVNGVNTFLICVRNDKVVNIKYWIDNSIWRDYEYNQDELLEPGRYSGVSEFTIIDNAKNHPVKFYEHPLESKKETKDDYQAFKEVMESNHIEQMKNINPPHKSTPITDKEIEETKEILRRIAVRQFTSPNIVKWINKGLEIIVMLQVENGLLNKQVKFYKDKESNKNV